MKTPISAPPWHVVMIASAALALAACEAVQPDAAQASGGGVASPASAATAATPRTAAPWQARDFQGDGRFTNLIEGPAMGPDGRLYLVGFGDARDIARIDPAADLPAPEVFASLPEGSAGNGIRFGADGTMFVADYSGHKIWAVDMKTRAVDVFANLEGAHQPNDIAMAPDGTLYASDPDWANATGQLWRIDRDGRATLLESGMGTTNGIEVNPDGTRLYVNESKQRKVWVYDIGADGTVANKRLFHEFADHEMDGMRTDQAGNLYIARYGAGEVAVLDPTGTLIQRVTLKGKDPTNIAFGGKDGRSVFVTMQDRGAIETFQSIEPGREAGVVPKAAR